MNETETETFVEAEKKPEKVRANYLGGIAGAVIGAGIAAVIYMVVLRFGRIMLSIWLPLLPIGGYYMLGKRINPLGAILITIVCGVIFFFAIRFGFAWNVQANALPGYSIKEVYDSIADLCDKHKEIETAYYKCMALGYGVSMLVTAVIAFIAREKD